MEKISILLILEAATGGTRRHVTDILTRINLDKFEPQLAVSILRDAAFKSDIEKIEERGIKVHILPMKRKISPISDLHNFYKLYCLIKDNSFDIVHTHSTKAGVLGRYAAHLAGVTNIIHTPHVFPFEMQVNKIKRMLYLAIEKCMAKFTKTLICVCQAELSNTVKYSIIHHEKIKLVENGIDKKYWREDTENVKELRKELNINPNDLVVGMPARFMPQKGHWVLIEAARKIVKEISKVKFLLIGDGELKEEVIELVESYKLGKYFIFLEQKEEIRSYYNIFDVFVMPSFWEALPYALLEAMAMKKAVIASGIGGITNLIDDGKNGIIFPVGQIKDLAQAVVKLYIDRDLRIRLAKNAGLIMNDNRFQVDSMIEKLEKIYIHDYRY